MATFCSMYYGGGYGGGFVEPPRDNCADENEIFIVNARDSLGLSLLAACLWKGPLATDRDIEGMALVRLVGGCRS